MFRSRCNTAAFGAATSVMAGSRHFSTGTSFSATKPSLAPFQDTKSALMMAPTAPLECQAVPVVDSTKKDEDSCSRCTRGEKVVLAVVVVGVTFWAFTREVHESTHAPRAGYRINIDGTVYILTPEQHTEFIALLKARFGEVVEKHVRCDGETDWKVVLPILEKSEAAKKDPKVVAAEKEAIAELKATYGRILHDGDHLAPVKWAPGELMTSVLPGDIVLFAGYGSFGAAVLEVGQSLQVHGTYWEHVAMVWDQINDKDGKVIDCVVGEATYGNTGKAKVRDYYTNEYYNDVRTVPFSDKVKSKLYDHIAIRRMKPEVRAKLNISCGPKSTNDTKARKDMWDLLKPIQEMNLKFPNHNWDGLWMMLRSGIHEAYVKNITWDECVRPGGRGVFCSQFVSQHWYRWGLLPNARSTELDLVVSAQWIPAFFTTNANHINEYYEREVYIECPNLTETLSQEMVPDFVRSIIDHVEQVNGKAEQEAREGTLD